MAQLRRNYKAFSERDTLIVTIGPEDAKSFRHYWEGNKLPFIGLPDEKHRVLKLYGQQVKIFKLGRQPAQMLIDKKGFLRYIYYGSSMADIPTVEKMLALINKLQDEQ